MSAAWKLSTWDRAFPVADYLLEVLLVRMKLWSQVQVVKKSVFLKAYVYEAGVEAGHEFPDFSYVHVAYGKERFLFLFWNSTRFLSSMRAIEISLAVRLLLIRLSLCYFWFFCFY